MMKPTQVKNNSARDSEPKKKPGWLFGVVSVIIILLLASLCMPLFTGKRRDADRTKAVGHNKQCLIAFTEFEDEHEVNLGAQATTSNDCFRALIQKQPTVRSEAIFFAPNKNSKETGCDIGDKPSNFSEDFTKGEVGFLYFHAPGAKFDAKVYNGNANILKTDGYLEVIKIDPDTGKVMVKVDGKRIDIFSSENPFFPDPPIINYPEPK